MARGDETAMVTGATSGLGLQFAEQLAQRGFGLALVARDDARLREVQADLISRYALPVEIIPADLVTHEGVSAVEARIAGRPLRVLVNNAGFGLKQPFDRATIDEEEKHLDIHVRTPMRLMHAALPAMLNRGTGSIINVASVSAFTPRGTYGAVKSWVVSLSRWANNQYRPRGVQVTAVCPGFVHTEFHQRLGASLDDIPSWMWLDAGAVVATALRDAGRGRAVSIPSLRYRALVSASRIVPSSLSQRFAARGR
ncbi:SDR family NAD(P)-dependent oxidoreductase [Paramicrobacterium chengjingii]|uniref:SDR family NAD(P)-dependent oxidoreductase n=1 Tax=Paramicrobacterium chengjingii TaxID=2769067 RepID=A0ABX6YEW2_9MICO|nr:SDR family NAD(P)-dependent oxidoreductase [Microbacterium chengjingii]QPZ37144.1 SDR family NAD(P)-dependent oxidoreductase [Microbacterium chengjingii]